MQDDVWNWANANAEVKALVLKKCSREGCDVRETTVAQFKRCAACHKAWYCGAACQKKDWEQHKPGLWRFSFFSVFLPSYCLLFHLVWVVAYPHYCRSFIFPLVPRTRD
jgi:hypothetical protein